MTSWLAQNKVALSKSLNLNPFKILQIRVGHNSATAIYKRITSYSKHLLAVVQVHPWWETFPVRKWITILNLHFVFTLVNLEIKWSQSETHYAALSHTYRCLNGFISTTIIFHLQRMKTRHLKLKILQQNRKLLLKTEMWAYWNLLKGYFQKGTLKVPHLNAYPHVLNMTV